MPKVNYLWNPINDNIIAEYDDEGNMLVEYTTEPDYHGAIVSEYRNGETFYHHYDGQGNTVALTNDAGDVTDRFSYTAFGEVTERTGSTPTPYQYMGKYGYYTDAETGTISARRRTLDAGRARWLSPDPLGFLDGWHLYTFVHNNPIRLIDPSGLAALDCGCNYYLDFNNRFVTGSDCACKPCCPNEVCEVRYFVGPAIGPPYVDAKNNSVVVEVRTVYTVDNVCCCFPVQWRCGHSGTRNARTGSLAHQFTEQYADKGARSTSDGKWVIDSVDKDPRWGTPGKSNLQVDCMANTITIIDHPKVEFDEFDDLAYFASKFRTCLYHCTIPVPETLVKDIGDGPYGIGLRNVGALVDDHPAIGFGKGPCLEFAVNFYARIADGKPGKPVAGIPTDAKGNSEIEVSSCPAP